MSVAAEAPLLQTAVGDTVEGERVQQMPLNGRNTMNLLTLTPGVIAGAPDGASALNAGTHRKQARWSDCSIGGGLSGGNVMDVDGTTPNMLGGNSIALIPTQDAVQKFRVMSSGVSPEFGRFSSGPPRAALRARSHAFIAAGRKRGIVMQKTRATHRMVTLIIVVVTTYLAATGTMIQLIDLRSIFTHAPADDPNVEAMHEDYYGPGGYAVIGPKDYAAPALAEGADLQAMLTRTMQSARLTAGPIPLQYVELRMADGKPVGIVSASGRLAQFDAQTGQIISAGPPPPPVRPQVTQFHQSPRNMFKVLHRMTLFGNYALFINVITGIGLFVMIITGILMYFRLLGARRKVGRANPFWSGGGWWKTWHRRVSIVAATFLVVVAFSGLWLAYESLYFGFYMGSAKQHADAAAFAARMATINPPALPVRKPDPMSAEAQPGRLASMQHDIGLTDDELAKVKLITDDSVKQMDALRNSGDPQQVRQGTGALHQAEADRIMAVLASEQRPRFQAWRDAQLLGTPAPAANGGRQGGDGQQGARNMAAGGPTGQGSPAGTPGGRAPRAANGGNSGRQGSGNGGAGGAQGGNAAVPLKDAELSSMLAVTLNGLQKARPHTTIKVVRLRDYAGIPQGVVVTGGIDTDQLVFDAKTGRPMSETEPGYPPVGFPFGWQAHQWGKAIHRGSVFGLPGRFMDLFAGLSLLYLSIGGIVMYVDYWNKTRKSKRLIAQHKLAGVA